MSNDLKIGERVVCKDGGNWDDGRVILKAGPMVKVRHWWGPIPVRRWYDELYVARVEQ